MDRVAAVFDAEKQSLTFSKIVSEMESLAAGFLSIGLKQGDRVLVAGSNHSQVSGFNKKVYHDYVLERQGDCNCAQPRLFSLRLLTFHTFLKSFSRARF